MGGAIQPLGYGQARNTSNYGSAFQPSITAQDIGIQDSSSLASMNIDTGLNTTNNWYDNVMGAGSMGKGGFMSSLPGYAISAFSAYDQNKTNKLNREATQYAMDRKKTEDKAYDKYKSDWSKMSFA